MSASTDRKARLQRYVESQKQRLAGKDLSPGLRQVIEIDVRKTQAVIEKLG